MAAAEARTAAAAAMDPWSARVAAPPPPIHDLGM